PMSTVRSLLDSWYKPNNAVVKFRKFFQVWRPKKPPHFFVGGFHSNSPFEIGFDWVCFGFVLPEGEGAFFVHNSLSYQDLCSFESPRNWVCFA
ncbi:MAG: hypothetical protein ACYS1A_16685, partial [Planctomycetota bacterium]